MDEISQVVELEYKGIYYTIKGSTKFISFVANMLYKLGGFVYKKFDGRAGSCSWDRLQRLSEGVPPILEFPKEMLEEKLMFPGEKEPMTMFEHYCKENNLHYCVLPDFNEYDDYVPIGVLAQDIAIHQEHIKAVMNKRIATEEDNELNYDKLLSELRDELANETDIKKKEELETKIENIEVAKDQNRKLLEESKQKLSNGNVIDFLDYIKQSEKTSFESDSEDAIEKLEEQGVIKEFAPEECMYPIRDKEMVPESNEVYYTQKSGDDICSVRRVFKEDDSGIVFSDYRIVDSKNPENIVTFTDKGLTNEKFKEKLPEILKKAGMIADKPTMAMRNVNAYSAYLRNINFKKASKELDYSSKEAEEFISKQVDNDIRRSNYDKSKVRSYTVPMDNVMLSDEQRLVFEVDGGLVEGAIITFSESDAQVSINKEKEYDIVKPDGSKTKMDGSEIISKMSDKSIDAKAQSHAKAR